ncbi:hypothetical protein Scep_022853 [Stephania cephalantha]|uniref:Berberine/berberine-like domain-containing protein n=1 Tax=Stephania cephalantha TaxID=152367 RepID=A0AAP0F6Z2_9MAGN
MSEISESEIPYPHREGKFFFISYEVNWIKEGDSTKNIEWMRSLYKYMAPYVSKNPRGAYINYRDLDLGQNRIDGSASYEEAKVWGVKYFNGNFDRLVKVKSKVDPSNFFNNEQTIPKSHVFVGVPLIGIKMRAGTHVGETQEMSLITTMWVLRVLCSSSGSAWFLEVIHERDCYYPSFLGSHTSRSRVKVKANLKPTRLELPPLPAR